MLVEIIIFVPCTSLLGFASLLFCLYIAFPNFLFVGQRHVGNFDLRRSAARCDPPTYIQYVCGLQLLQPIHICKISDMPLTT
jgi:hypothetical protein